MLVFNSKVACPFLLEDLQKFIATASRQEKQIAGDISVTVVGEKEIQKLNWQTRGKNKPTDVLSFAFNETAFPTPRPTLGEIYLCYPYIVKQAKRFMRPPKEEFLRMFIHGLLHLAGHDHVTVKESEHMFKLQEKILSLCAY